MSSGYIHGVGILAMMFQKAPHWDIENLGQRVHAIGDKNTHSCILSYRRTWMPYAI
jgi:hypothetical protein